MSESSPSIGVACAPCHAWPDPVRPPTEIEAEIQRCVEAWQLDRIALQNDHDFIRRWLALLEEQAASGGRADEGNMRIFRRLLDQTSCG